MSYFQCCLRILPRFFREAMGKAGMALLIPTVFYVPMWFAGFYPRLAMFLMAYSLSTVVVFSVYFLSWAHPIIRDGRLKFLVCLMYPGVQYYISDLLRESRGAFILSTLVSHLGQAIEEGLVSSVPSDDPVVPGQIRRNLYFLTRWGCKLSETWIKEGEDYEENEEEGQ